MQAGMELWSVYVHVCALCCIYWLLNTSYKLEAVIATQLPLIKSCVKWHTSFAVLLLSSIIYDNHIQ